MGLDEQFDPRPGEEPDDGSDSNPMLTPEYQLRLRLLSYIEKETESSDLRNLTEVPSFLWPRSLSEQLTAAELFVAECNQKLAVVNGELELRVHSAVQAGDQSFLAVTLQVRHPQLEEFALERYAVPSMPPKEIVARVSSMPDLTMEQFERPVLLVSSSENDWRKGSLPTLIVLEREYQAMVQNAIAQSEEVALAESDSRSPREVDEAHTTILHRLLKRELKDGLFETRRDAELDDLTPEECDPYERVQSSFPVYLQRVRVEDLGDAVIFDVEAKTRVIHAGRSDFASRNFGAMIGLNPSTGVIGVIADTVSIAGLIRTYSQL